jgi:hypothetical protein
MEKNVKCKAAGEKNDVLLSQFFLIGTATTTIPVYQIDGLTHGAIAGIVVGTTLSLLLVVVAGHWYKRHLKAKIRPKNAILPYHQTASGKRWFKQVF